MSNIHNKKPARREIEARAQYTLYRAELREDFNQSCGYCDDSDQFLDRICFHIDHFAPKKRFPDRATTYSNLIYACRFCNIKKSNRWISDNADTCHDGTNGFVDPCTEEFDTHVTRSDGGGIVALTNVGRYMVKHLNLGLLRHELLWKSRQMRQLRAEIDEVFETARARDKALDLAEELDLLRRFKELTDKIERYESLAAAG